MLSEIRTAKMLAEGMQDLREELLADLESSGKEIYFKQAVEILLADENTVGTENDMAILARKIDRLADENAVETENNMVILARRIYRLAYETPELRKYLFGRAPDGMSAGFNSSTKKKSAEFEKKNQMKREVEAGIPQQLFVLVKDEKSLETDDPESLFNCLLAKLGQ